MSKVGVNAFIRRQTPESKFSHFAGTWEELVALVEQRFHFSKPGYRDGVILVPVPPIGFYTDVVEVTPETKLHATFEARANGEVPFIQVVAVGGEKLPALAVEIVVYRHNVLAEDGDASTDCEWEIISINARPTEDPEPLTPMAMARNFLEQYLGGTKATYTAEEFAEAIVYWSTRAMRE